MPEAGEETGCAGSSEAVLAVLKEAETDDMGCLFKTKRVSAKTPDARAENARNSASIIGSFLIRFLRFLWACRRLKSFLVICCKSPV